jgi:magnesium transporter
VAARPDERLTKSADHADASRDQRLARTMYRVRGETRTELEPSAIVEALRNREGVLWVDIDAAERHQHALLEKVFNFHPLAIEDTLNPNSRVKLEEYDGYLYAIIRGVEFDESTEDPYDLGTLNL